MAYTVEVKSSEVVFKERDIVVKIVSVLVFLIGLPALLLGILVLLFSERSFVSFYMTGFGLAFTSAGVLLKSLPPKPASFAFNNFQETFTVTEKDGRTAAFGYGEIQDFKVRQNVSSAGDGRSVTWALTMQKKDGSFWDLFCSGKPSVVQDTFEKVKQHVRLPGTNVVQSQKAPDFVFHEKKRDKTIFWWKNKHALLNNLFASFLVGGFCFLLYGVALKNQVVGYIFFVPLACLTGYLMGAFLSGLGKVCLIVVDKDSLKYGMGTPDLKKWKTTKEMPLAKIKKTQFSFGIEQTIPTIAVLDEEDARQMEKITSGEAGLSDVVDVFKFMTRVFNIHLYGLRVVDAMRFEQFLDATLKEYGGNVL